MTDKTETILEEILAAFAEKMKVAAKDAIGDAERDYLPWLETDLGMNVPIITVEIIQGFLEGRTHDLIDLSGYDMRRVRQKIFEDNREEIIAALKKDFTKEIENLKREVKANSRRAW